MIKRFRFARGSVKLVLVSVFVLLAIGRLASEVVLRKSLVYQVPVNDKVIALTYDDGPHPEFTPRLLNVLDKYHVKATLFMIGSRMEEYPDIVKAVNERGHVIANHTYTHPNDMDVDNITQIKRELSSCELVIERIAGKQPYLFRPPRGLVNGTTAAVVEKAGYKIILWSVCADNHNAKTPELMAQRVLQRVHPGSIILAYDGTYGTRWKDVAATSIIIETLKERGYRFVTVPELLKIVPQNKLK